MLTFAKCSSTAIVIAIAASGPAAARTVAIPFNSSNFSHPLHIDNVYFPLVAGTVFTYKSDTPDGCEVDVMTVTSRTRFIDGVTTRVVHDVVSEGDTCGGPLQKAEDTLDYYAQDDSGNVWYMGEDTFDCTPSGCTPGEGGWIGGVSGGHPGIVMLANPRSGDTYRQEFRPGIAEDQATVTAIGITAKPKRADAYRSSYGNCIKTKEFTVLEKGAIGSKTYCPNVGIVVDIDHHGKIQRSELTSISSTANALKFRTVSKP